MGEKPKYSIVVPLFNEEEVLHKLYERLISLIEVLAEPTEVLFVNDGSRDRTLDILRTLAAADSRIRFLSFSRNFGHQAALSAGLAYTSGKAVISMDGDLQDPPEIIVQLIERWKQGYDVVYARRQNYRKDNAVKRLGTRMFYSVSRRFSNFEIPGNVGDFRLLDRKVVEEINTMPEKSRYLRGMVAWTGYPHAFVDYHRPDRTKGESAYTLSKLVKLALDGVFNFSFLPLKLGLYVGVFSILFGTFFLGYMFYVQLIETFRYQLYMFLIVVLFIFMGFLFILLWLIGEYIGRIYDQVRDRPVYVIDEKANFDADTHA